ncbi:hypothetical protein, partial [Candidatus Competibacter phosphatis]|uniref:hypothetical protein n=1 Tax=Candidatus Competibacter phosphatis TaxID=221280 RepID=UPI001B7E203D
AAPWVLVERDCRSNPRLVGFGKPVARVIAGRIGRGTNGLQHPYAGAERGMNLKQRVGKLEQHRGSGRFIYLTTSYPNETAEGALVPHPTWIDG